MLKLNLGCGLHKKQGYVNVDRDGDPDVKHDLETFPWPWGDYTIDEIRMVHVLEHLGQDPKVYKQIWQELYRVCCPGAKLQIVVPHWRHDHFYADPTHVRAVTPLGLCLMSKQFNKTCDETGAANSPLAMWWGVDFEVVKATYVPSKLYRKMYPGEVDGDLLLQESELCNNMIEEIAFEMKAIKCYPAIKL